MARTNRGIVKVYAGTDGIPTVEVGSGLPGAQGEQGLPGAGGPGTTVVGNVVTWNSTNGTVLADGGIALDSLAPKASPALTGVPTAPTAAAATNTTQIATTAMVQAALAAYIAAQNVLVFKGVIDCSANPNYPAADAGWVYKVSVAGKIGGASGTNVEVGDVLTCLVDASASGTQAAVGANWIVSQVNIDGAVTGPVSAVDAAVAGFNGVTGKIIKSLTAAEIRTAAALATSDSPQFTALNVGNATDTTIARSSAGVITVEGVEVTLNTLAQILSGKSLVDNSTYIIDETDATKKVQIAVELTPTATTNVLSAPPISGVLLTDPCAATVIPPTLDLDFRNINGAPFAGNLTRATAGGYRQNSKGVYVPTVVNEPNIDFSAGVPLGTGFYGAYTNLALWSEDFTNAAWAKTRSSISANAAVAPDGATTADKLVEDTTATNSHYTEQTYAATASVVYTFTVFAKAAERTRIRLSTYNGSVSPSAIFDLSAGTVVSSANGATGAIEAVGNGWYRCSIILTMATTSTLFYGIHLDNGTSNVYTGDGTSGLYVWGAQLTATAFPVPYVPTTSATVARNADSMIISGTDFTDFFNSVEGTLFVEARAPIGATTFPLLASLDDGTGNNRHIFNYIGSSSQISCSTEVGGVTQASASFGVAPGASFKIAQSYKSNAFLAAISGMSFLTDTSGSLPSGLNRLAVGTGFNSTVTWWNEHIRRIIYWPKALTALELQRMTA